MRPLVDNMNPDDRLRFFDELPEEAWQRLMDELSGAVAAETSASMNQKRRVRRKSSLRSRGTDHRGISNREGF